jgi:predicted transcriptional regulator
MSTKEDEYHDQAEVDRWQIEEIKNGLEEADRGEFASDEEVQQTLMRLMRVSPAIPQKRKSEKGSGSVRFNR